MYLYLFQDEKISGRRGRDTGEGRFRLSAGAGEDCSQFSSGAGEDRSLLSEALVRKALEDYCRRENRFPADLWKEAVIQRDEKGKPYLADFPPPGSGVPAIHFSVSHSGDLWGCIMAGEPVGFDMERIQERVNCEKVAKRFFTEEEHRMVLSQGRDVFFDLWVRKEAYVKYLGTGLSAGLSGFSVVEDDKLSERVLSRGKDAGQEEGCYLRSCAVHSGFKAAYCCASGKPVAGRISLKMPESGG